MENNTEAIKIRKPYQKPQIEKIRLVAEEAVLAACLNGSFFGPGATGCEPGGTQCSALTS